jgi:hypothetical protein
MFMRVNPKCAHQVRPPLRAQPHLRLRSSCQLPARFGTVPAEHVRKIVPSSCQRSVEKHLAILVARVERDSKGDEN